MDEHKERRLKSKPIIHIKASKSQPNDLKYLRLKSYIKRVLTYKTNIRKL